ncbi:putative rhoptry protein [Toxoplasma gondii FOU]|uniref:Putative rhoptry protein n=2 Tax=Toxoplasma gondii TaxID=5811 RepID=A0A086LI61_TOXGO|nr:putative rhoptry protein [Toxoplasma gondii FOU]PUA86597.1 putative rhoptry protein [Toxoplasma gondii TgCATBr9]
MKPPRETSRGGMEGKVGFGASIRDRWFFQNFSDGLSNGEKSWWRRSVVHFLQMADPTWSCRETRRALEPGMLEKMKSTYWLTRIVFIRALSFVYFVAFLVAFNQAQGLIGSDGILPAQTHADSIREVLAEEDTWTKIKAFPSLFLFLPANDFWIHCLPFLGILVSLVTGVLGGSNGFVMLFLWILYQSVNSIGQEWYAFGWESELLEIGFLSIWLCPFWSFSRLPASWPTPKICVWGNRWLLFRLMLGAGLIKLRNDSLWTDLTALDYHYETMPIPNPFSWYMHNQSHTAHAFQVIVNHVVECVFPFLLLIPFRQCRLVGGVTQILFQGAIIFSGNFSFLNHLSILPALMTLDDNFVSCLFPSKTLERLQPLLQGCLGAWSLPKHQAWPVDSCSEHTNEHQGVGSVKDPEAAALLNDGGSQLEWSVDTDDDSNQASARTCCCWYSPRILQFFRSIPRTIFPSRARNRMKRDMEESWKSMLLELVVSIGVLVLMAVATRSESPSLLSVLAIIFLCLALAASSHFYTKTATSNVFTELVLLVVSLWSAVSLYKYGPLPSCLWLTIVLFTILLAFSYKTISNAVLVYKIHVELLLLLLIISLSVPVVANLLSPNQLMNASMANPFDILNTYGAFGTVTTERWELTVQGTDDPTPDENSTWINYEFKCKPGDVNRRPCLISPYHYRLDWLMWFVPMDIPEIVGVRHPWFPRFLGKLLQNSPSVTGLLADNPFKNKDPPTAVRVLKTLYRFTKRPFWGSGPWWEIVPNTTSVFVAPGDVPDADQHLEQMIVLKRVQEQKAQEELLRKELKEEQRKARERAEAEKMVAEEERKKLLEQRTQEELETKRRIQEEKELREKQAEEMRKQEEEQRKKQEAEEKARAAAEEARKRKEVEIARAQEEQEAERQREAAEEEKRKKEAQRKAEEEAAKLRKEEARKRDEEAAKLAEQRESLRRKEQKEKQAMLAKKRAEAAEKEQERNSQLSDQSRASADGGVPLRAAALFNRKKAAIFRLNQ